MQYIDICINLVGFTCARPHTYALLWRVWRIKGADLWGRDAPLKMVLSGCRLLLMTPLCTRDDQKEVRSPSWRQPADVLRATQWRQQHFDNLCLNPCLAEDCQCSSIATGSWAGIKPGKSHTPCKDVWVTLWSTSELDPRTQPNSPSMWKPTLSLHRVTSLRARWQFHRLNMKMSR